MEILNCDKHGDHEVKEQEIMGRTFRFTKCPKCSEEQMRSISNISKTRFCGMKCSKEAIGSANRKQRYEIQSRFGIEVIDYSNYSSPMKIKKGCVKPF